MNIIKTNSRIIQIKVSKGNNSWYFNDSFALLPSSLYKLTHGFNVKHKKKDINYEEMKDSEETREYLRHDTVGLYEVLEMFESMVAKFGVGLEMTSARQALNMYKTFMKYPLPNYEDKEEFIRRGYYGGRCEIFKMREQDLNYYDINSLYPFCMRNFEMPVGIPMIVHGNPLKEGISFCEAIVNIPESISVPPLPFRMKLKSGSKLVFPVGKIKGVWDRLELENAERMGCTVKHIKSLCFSGDMIFKDYVDRWYKIKNESQKDSSMYYISKLMLNSLYGKFGQKRESKKMIMNPKQCVGLYPLYEDYEIYEKDCYSHATHILPAISAHVTAIARLELYKWIEKAGFGVVYCDTDSIVTQNKLPTSIKIGAMKLEKKTKDGIFLLPKLYAFVEGEVRAKGYSQAKEYINFRSFEKALMSDDYSDFNIIFERFGLFSENIRRHNPIVSMVTRKKSIKSRYDKRIRIENFETKPLSVVDFC